LIALSVVTRVYYIGKRVYKVLCQTIRSPSVLWHCWLGVRRASGQ